MQICFGYQRRRRRGGSERLSPPRATHARTHALRAGPREASQFGIWKSNPRKTKLKCLKSFIIPEDIQIRTTTKLHQRMFRDGWMDGWLDGCWIEGWMDEGLDGWKNGWVLDGWMIDG